MKSWFAWTLFVLALAAVADGFYAYHWYFAKDGSCVQKAIVIEPSEHQLEDEYAWVSQYRGGALPVEQALFCVRGRLYEKWTFGLSTPHEELYFDLGINGKICDAKSEFGFAK